MILGSREKFCCSNSKVSSALIALGLLVITALSLSTKTVQENTYTLDASMQQRQSDFQTDDDWNTNTETISLHVSEANPKAFFSISAKTGTKKISPDCRSSDGYMCISSTQSKDNRNTIFNFRAKKIGTTGNVMYFDYQRTIETGAISNVSMKISDNRWIRIYSDKTLLYAYRFNSRYGISAGNRDLQLDHAGIPSEEYASHYFIRQIVSEGNALNNAILFLSSLLIAIGLFLKRNFHSTKYEYSSGVRKMLLTSFVVTSVSATVGLLGWYRRPNISHDFGISFEPVVRFSDFFQVWSFSEFTDLYRTIRPDYPPLQILVFKILGELVRPEIVFLQIVVIAGVMTYFLINSMLGCNKKLCSMIITLTFYPLLYAIERGSLDLIIFPIFACALFFFDKKKYTKFAVLIGIVAGLKVLPIIFIVMVLRQSGKVKNILVAVSTAISLNCAAALMLPEAGASEIMLYARHLLESIVNRGSKSTSFPVADNSLSAFFNMLGYFSSWLGAPGAITLFLILSIVSVMSLFLLTTVRYREISSEQLGLVALVTMLLLVPNSFNYRLMFFVPMVWLWNRNRNPEKVNNELISLQVLLGVLLSAHPLIYLERGPGFWGQVINAPLLMMVLIVLASKNQKYMPVNSEDKFPVVEYNQ